MLDDDLYKFTTQQAILQHYPEAEVEYTLMFRTPIQFPSLFLKEFQKQLDNLRGLALTKEEEDYLHTLSYFKSSYIEYLKNFRYNPSADLKYDISDDNLSLKIRGPWRNRVLYEVKLMAIISELYFYFVDCTCNYLPIEEYQDKNRSKATSMNEIGVPYLEFGTRRRFSYENHKQVLKNILEVGGNTFKGTSNLHFAMISNLKPGGSIPHEWIMYHGAIYGYRMANIIAYQKWTETYGEYFQVALTDTYTTNVFLKSYDHRFASCYALRQDSGDTGDFARKTINHLIHLKLDPKSRYTYFSNGLHVPECKQIKESWDKELKLMFGIGTSLTNDVGRKPINMVIKLSGVYFQGMLIPTVKLGDGVGKEMGEEEVDICKKTLRIA